MQFSSLTEYLHHWANCIPDQPFVCSTNRKLTYSEAAAEVDRRTQIIVDMSEGQPVLVTGINSSDWVLHVLAVLQSGLPLVLLPPTMQVPEAKRITALSAAGLRIEGESFTRFIPPPEEECSSVFHASGAVLAFPSSGSTGAMKLVLRSSASLVDEGERYLRLWNLTPADTVMAILPLCHAYALGAALAGTLVSGATLWVGHFVSHRSLTAEICNAKITALPLVRPIAQALALGDGATPISSRLRIAMVGASPIAANTAITFHARWGVWLSQNYGSAETGAVLASFYPDSAVSTGIPIPTVKCALIPDYEGKGQLWVKLQAPPLGYFTEAGWDCTKLSPDHWWPTGDLFSRDKENNFVFRQRIGSEIRRGGRNIQPCEIEDALREHPAVKEVCITGGKDFNGQERVEATVQFYPGMKPSISDLREHLLARISEYKIPTQWTFTDALPLTWSGKINPQSIQYQPSTSPVAPWSKELMSYRTSEALLAAENLGLIELLARSSLSTCMLSEELRLDPTALNIFLLFLENAKLVHQDQGRWSIVSAVPGDWRQICCLESELRHSWLSSSALEQVLQKGLSARDFDLGMSSEQFVAAYAQAVCGPALTLAVQHILRILKIQAASNVLEIGRGVGCLCLALPCNTGIKRVIPLAPAPAILYPAFRQSLGEESLPVMHWEHIKLRSAEFDLIALVNCIHWIRPEEFSEVFHMISKGLSPAGRLIILDTFLSSGPEVESGLDLSSLFLLDWMTHGGCFWLTTSELLKRLGDSGFGRTEIRSFQNLQPCWIIAYPNNTLLADESHLEKLTTRSIGNHE